MVKPKTKTKKALGEFLFWLHTVLIAAIIVSGFFFSVWIVLLIILFVKFQQIIFKGCFITRLEMRTGDIARNKTYYQLAAKRFIGLSINRHQVKILSLFISILTMVIAIIANHYGYRIYI